VLAPEDPRLADFERDILRKLRRTLPQLRVQYAASSVSGLFEKPEDHYGEIWYEMNGQKDNGAVGDRGGGPGKYLQTCRR
jgi:hypothetical protein